MIAKKQPPPGAEFGSPLESYVRLMFTEMLAAMARTLRNDSLSLPQLAALHIVAARGPVRIGALAEELLLPMPAASRLTTELVKRGLLERREDATDRRAKTVSVSPAGFELIALISQRRSEEASSAVMHGATGPVHRAYMEMFAQLVAAGMAKAPPSEGGNEPESG